MDELKRHKMAYKVLCPIIGVFLKFRFGYEYDDLKKIEGPYLLLVNHNMELDPASIGVAVRNPLYFVASEHIMRKGAGTWFLTTFFKPITHVKGRQGVATVKQMLKTLKEGHSVCIFPEGNRSFNGVTGEMLPAIGRVAKKSGAKLITFRIEGGYLSQPRWSLTWRKGKLRGRLVHEYTPEQLKAMTDEELNQAIVTDLHEDAYETQKRERIAYKGRRLAEGIESTLFLCPACKEIGQMRSRGDKMFCTCGFSAVYDVYGEITDNLGNVYTVTRLDAMQKQQLEEVYQSCQPDTVLFSDMVTWYEIGKAHEIIKEEQSELIARKECLECCKRTISYEQLEGMAIYSRNFLNLHFPDVEGHIEIKADEGFSALKYLYLYELYRQNNPKVKARKKNTEEK